MSHPKSTSPANIRVIINPDAGQMGDAYFLIRVSFGFEAKLVEKAQRSLKAEMIRAQILPKALKVVVPLDSY